MDAFRVEAVGDGLCTAVKCGDECLHADCGDGGSGRLAAGILQRLRGKNWKAESLLLSHFHADHANGFSELYVQKQQGVSVDLEYRDVYFPRIPQTSEHTDLHDRIVTAAVVVSIVDLVLNAARWTHRGGIPLPKGNIAVVDVLAMVDYLCGGATRHPVSQGEGFVLSTDLFEVAWPPREADPDLETLMEDLSGLFDAAVRQLPLFRSVFGWVVENQISQSYDSFTAPRDRGHVSYDLELSRLISLSDEPTPGLTEQVVDKMAGLLNALSLAFCVSDSVLFFGDVTPVGVSGVVRYLTRSHRDVDIVAGPGAGTRVGPIGPSLTYETVVSPHHGTDNHWHRDFANLTVGGHVVHSAGPGLSKHFCTHYDTCFHGQNWKTHPNHPYPAPL